jgi:hypothetical protein
MDVGTGIWDYQAICGYILEPYLANRAWLKTFGKEPAGGRFRQESILAKQHCQLMLGVDLWELE